MESPSPPMLQETVTDGLTSGEIRAVTHERLRLLSWGYSNLSRPESRSRSVRERT